MNNKLVLGTIISLISIQTFAASFGVFDPRSLAMGNVGVASGDASNANYYNPALLALPQRKGNIGIVIPSITARISDPDSLQDALKDYDNGNYEDALDTAITTFNASGGTLANPVAFINSAATTATAAQNLLTAVKTLSDKAITFNAQAGALFAMSSPEIGFSAGYSSRIVGGGQLNISSSDTTLVQSYVDILSCIGNISTSQSAAAITAAYTACDSNNIINDVTGFFSNTNTANTLTSTIAARGAAITETSLSLAHQFRGLNDLAIGITPKIVKVTTYDYSIGIDSGKFSTDTGKTEHNSSNLDIGIARLLSPDVRIGLVTKNIITRKYVTALNNTIKVEPQYRAGIAYQNDFALVAFDLDLQKNKGLGFEEDTQYAALGGEFNVYDILQLRAGYRHNLKASSGRKAGLPSIGLGVEVLAVHFDFAYASNGDEQQAGLQFAVKF